MARSYETPELKEDIEWMREHRDEFEEIANSDAPDAWVFDFTLSIIDNYEQD